MFKRTAADFCETLVKVSPLFVQVFPNYLRKLIARLNRF